MDRRRIIALAVSAVAVGATLAVAVNVATSPETASWARWPAWLVTVTAAVVAMGLGVWQAVWYRTDARRTAQDEPSLRNDELEAIGPTEDESRPDLDWLERNIGRTDPEEEPTGGAALEDDEDKPPTGEFPPLRLGTDSLAREQPPDPAGLPPARTAPQAPARATSHARLVVLEQRVLSILDPQVGQDETQIASAARITPGETARTLQRLEERGLVVPSRPRSTGARIVRRYLKR